MLAQRWSAAQGQASPATPGPGLMQLVVPSSRTMEQLMPSGQLEASRRVQGVTGVQVGMGELVVSSGATTSETIVEVLQNVFSGHASLSPQQ